MAAGMSVSGTDMGLAEPDPGGCLGGTLVRTLDGLMPVAFLGPGDRIVCRRGARRLLGVTARHLPCVELVRLRASTLGHDRPDRDVLLAPDQKVLIRDWRARVLYGQPLAAVAAARLVDGEFIQAETHAEARLFTLHFAEAEVIYAEGLELSCPVRVPLMAALSA